VTDAEILLAQIDEACRRLKIAQTTFGRQAVNDGKLVSRLQQGGRVTLQTVDRVHRFIAERGGPSAARLGSVIGISDRAADPVHGFRFYDNRQKYLMFVNTTSEKQIVADKALEQLDFAQPEPPAIRLLDGGSGDGTVLARLLRGAHRRFPWLPFYVVAKEISIENVRLMLEKMPDRFQEHPSTVLVVTNLNYADAPWLRPSSPVAASAMSWTEVALEGSTAGEFEESIAALQPVVDHNWQVEVSRESGLPMNKTPAVLIIYRKDQQFVLDSIIPRRGLARADFDFVLLSHPYRARATIDFKARKVIAPLVRALRPNGRLLGIHGYGHDPGLDLVRSIWPGEDPFTTGRRQLMEAVARELGGQARGFRFHKLADVQAIFRYPIRMLETEIADGGEIGISTVLAAWNAATYVTQIEDARLAAALNRDRYVEVTRETLKAHRGLWFNNEMFVISRRAELGAQ
jgi:SAM-dependent methyltransferase